MVCGSLFATNAFAVSAGDLGLSESQIQAILDGASAPAGAPGITSGSPAAFGLDWGQAAAAIGGNTLPKTSSDDYDGSMSVAAGLGDASKYVGLEVAYSVNSLRSNFGDEGAAALKLHTNLPGRAAFAVGVENVARFGPDTKRGRSSVYAVGTKVFDLLPQEANSIPVAVNLGIGDNRFQDANDTGANVFGGVSAIVHPQLSLIADWTGRDLNAAVSVLPFKAYPLTVGVGAINLAKRNNADVEFAGSIGYLFRF
jgi:hypothetical protein